jgi:NADPH-dependent 2,4-dienoyl-CoA reductase/sulfur reductase-like enzyme/nitrite reductase/ring-hydroxylating ferredoxin subunit
MSDPVPAASLADIPTDRGLAVEVNGEKILLVRDGDAVRAFEASCPHAGAPLDEGAVCNGHIVCPWHKGSFAAADGSLVEPPPLRALKRYEVCLDGDQVHIGAELSATPAATPGAATTPAPATALIAGAGAAGAAAAAALRGFGYTGRIVLAGVEPAPPYDRTSLSKFVLAGEMPLAELPALLPEDFCPAHGIDRVTAEITRLDTANRRATLADGTTLDFTTALIATGGAPSRPDLPGTDLQGVHVLRSRADAAKILADIHAGSKIVILGSSFIGLEAASSLRAQACDVTVIAPEPIPFARRFGPEIGAALRALHEDHGVHFHLGTQAVRLDGKTRVTAAVLENGATIEADTVLLATGVKPAAQFVHGVPHAGDGGLIADAHMRVAENIYAAGDIVHFPLPHGGPGGGTSRIEHWRVAQQQAPHRRSQHGRRQRHLCGGAVFLDLPLRPEHRISRPRRNLGQHRGGRRPGKTGFPGAALHSGHGAGRHRLRSRARNGRADRGHAFADFCGRCAYAVRGEHLERKGFFLKNEAKTLYAAVADYPATAA